MHADWGTWQCPAVQVVFVYKGAQIGFLKAGQHDSHLPLSLRLGVWGDCKAQRLPFQAGIPAPRHPRVAPFKADTPGGWDFFPYHLVHLLCSFPLCVMLEILLLAWYQRQL